MPVCKLLTKFRPILPHYLQPLQQLTPAYYFIRTGVPLQKMRLPVFLLYTLFFVVQVFFNFDICAAQHLTGKQQKAKYAHSTILIKRIGNTNKPVLSKFRLNKRYQPSAPPAIAEFAIALPEQPIVRQVPAYQDPFHNDPNNNSTSLRGPPRLV